MADGKTRAARESPAVEGQAAALPEVAVHVRPIEPRGSLIGMADVKIGGLTVENFKVFNSKNGVFLGMPSVPDSSTRSGFRRTAWATEELQAVLDSKAYEGYNAAVERLQARAAAAQAMVVKPSIREGLREGAEQAAKANADRPAPERTGRAGKDDR